MYNHHSFPIRIVSRAKLSGFGEHWGVQLPNGNVAHLTSERGQKVVSFSEFAQGLPVKEIRRSPPHLYYQTLHRLDESIRNPRQYRLLGWNCENYANWLIGEKPESPQINGLAIVGAIALVVKLAA